MNGTGKDMMLKLAVAIDKLNARIGIAVAYLIYVIMAIMMIEIVLRSFFSLPTTWTRDLSSWTLVFYVFLGAAFALQQGYFVRVDVLYQRFPGRLQAFVTLVAGTALMMLFSWIMISKGWDFGMRSLRYDEVPISGAWNAPVWPSKLVIPVGTTLLFLAWLSLAIRAAGRLFARDQTSPDAPARPGG